MNQFKKNKVIEIVKEELIFSSQLISTKCQQEEFLKIKSLQEIQFTMINHKNHIYEIMQNHKFQVVLLRTHKTSQTKFLKTT